MNKVAQAESALVAKLDVARSQIVNSPPMQQRKKVDVVSGKSKPKPVAADSEDEARAVLNLEVPSFDKTRSFKGIENQKIGKKDRHLKAIEGFGKDLEDIAEKIEQELLILSRAVRENIELIDKELSTACDLLKKDDYLVNCSSDDLDASLVELKSITSRRSATVEKFGVDLENMECRRAATVGSQIKQLVDNLVAIAHQLPDDIEHIVEAEAFDLNTVLTKNRQAHAELLGVMRTKQIEISVTVLHEWDVAKTRWRLLRHRKAIGTFHADMQGADYTEPSDRQQFMTEFRAQQTERHACRMAALKDLARLDANNITSDEARRIKAALTSLNEEELAATQECYNGLSGLRARLRGDADRRMEALRKELHVYGALHDEPPLAELAANLRAALSRPELSELWRLGGGLKAEIAAVANEICSEDIVYDHLVTSVQSRLEVILCGFNLKEVLNDRGRLPRLDAVRSLLSKLRTVPRAEVGIVLTNLLPDLKEMSALDKMPATFQLHLSECVEGIEAEVERLAAQGEDGGGVGTVGSRISAESSTAGKTRRTARSRAGTADSVDKSCHADPMLVKQWMKVLGMLYYGSDIPEEDQMECVRALDAIREQRVCNQHVDVVIKAECDFELDRLDNRYKRLIDSIATFLELQTGSLSHTSNQISDFYIKVATIMENHKKKQTDLDEASLDLLWDLSEENRLAKEGREIEFQEACNALRRSADMNDLQKNFETVLAKLSQILDSYRMYHGLACYNADKHPISLADDYVEHMNTVCQMFHMEAIRPHRILDTHHRLHETNKRLNKKYLTAPPPASSRAQPNAKEQVSENGDPDEAGDVPQEDEKQEGEEREVEAPVVETPREEVGDKEYVDIFFIPDVVPEIPDNMDMEDGEEVERDLGAGRKYGLVLPLNDFVNSFVEETGQEEEEDEPLQDVAASFEESHSGDADDFLGEDANLVVTDYVNPDYPWLVMKRYPGVEDAEMVTLKTPEQLEKMDDDEVIAYEDSIEKHFVARDPKEPFEVMTRAQPSEGEDEEAGDGPLVLDKVKSANLRAAYELTQEIVERAQRRREMQTPKYLRENPPLDTRMNPFALLVDVEFGIIKDMLTDLRASLVGHLEVTSAHRIEASEVQCRNRKNEFTDELEDLLRTHWPRCGLVETQIKRPREVELLNHEEKTYRFILSIQEKMSALQCKFDDEVESTHKCCEAYFENIQSLVRKLTEVQFKTLAALQVGASVRAVAEYMCVEITT